jgi:hypothetical protein
MRMECLVPLFLAAVLGSTYSLSAQANRAISRTASKAIAPPQPELFATVDHNTGWGGLFSRGPRVAVYRDGSVIFAKRTEGESEATYYRGTLTIDELWQVDAKLQASYAVMNKDIHLAPGWHDLPRVTLSVLYLNKPKTITVEGFALGGHFSPPATDKKKRPDHLPLQIDRGAKILMYLDPANSQPWKPELYEVKLSTSMHEIPETVQKWPAEWPDLKSKSTTETRYGRREEREYSIVLPASEHARYLDLEKSSRYFSINGQTLLAYHWLPVLPDSPRWRQYQRGIR